MGVLFTLAVAVSAGGCGKRGGGGGGMLGRDSGVSRIDSGPRPDGAAEEDAFVPMVDSGGGRDTGTPARDGGGGPSLGCEPACMAMPGAVCCQDCACGGATVRCTPRCPTPYRWDCEIMCCFDYDTFECFMGEP
jgi:hypothetical protein